MPVERQEVVEGIKILSVNYRKDLVELDEFLQICLGLFHDWPSGLFKSTCIEIIKKESYFPVAATIIEYGGRIVRKSEMSKPKDLKLLEERFHEDGKGRACMSVILEKLRKRQELEALKSERVKKVTPPESRKVRHLRILNS
jgi:hypothetical protein